MKKKKELLPLKVYLFTLSKRRTFIRCMDVPQCFFFFFNILTKGTRTCLLPWLKNPSILNFGLL